ncbi:reverse transcriptase domain-containing protein [Tanacetum coccineum]
MTVVTNEDNELVPTRTFTGWRVCIDYRKLNEATRKDHFALPFMDQMLERLAGNKYFCFLDGFSGYFQIPIELADQEKTTFTCPYGTYAYKRMLETSMEVFMDDFLVFGESFNSCLTNLEQMLIRCKQARLVLNWEKCHFMMTEGIVLGHKVSSKGLEVDKLKIDMIAKLPLPTNVKAVRSFLRHVGFYRRFIKDFSKISKPVIQRQRRLNPNMKEVVKKEIIKLLDAGIIYAIEDSPWVSPVHCVPKKGGMTVVTNEDNELVPTRTVTGWRVCIDYRKLNEATRKDHFPLPFMDQMLERLAGNKFFCFLDGFSGYFQIPIEPADQEKTTFTCPYGTYAYKRMPFGLCNAPATFQRCMIAIFQDMLETSMEVFMDDFSVFGDSFDSCLTNLEQMLIRCKQAHLVLNWEKCHFMVTEGIVLGHKVSSKGLEVDKAKIDMIAKLPPPTNVKAVRSFLGHAEFYRRFIKDFSKISRPMTKLLEKDLVFNFDQECNKAFKTLKEKLTNAPIMVSPNWSLLFELMCDASDFAVGAMLGQRDEKHFRPIYFASKTLNRA